LLWFLNSGWYSDVSLLIPYNFTTGYITNRFQVWYKT